MFPIQTLPLSTANLRNLSGDDFEVHTLPDQGSVGEAYVAYVSGARRSLVVFGGNGNELKPLLALARPHVTQLSMNLLSMNYWAKGHERVTVAAVRVAAERLIEKATTITPGSLCVLGHGFGSWLALEAASRADVRGVVLAAVGTTPKDLTVAQAGIWRPLV